jgi:hypothetical protein
MQTLTFDTLGNLTPSEKITVDLETLKLYFVDAFPESETRKTLFDNYLRYLDAFAKEITPHFTQWINGSFVTQKENPNDMDFVTFLDIKTYERIEPNIDKYLTTTLHDNGLDAYILQVYPTEIELYTSYTLFHTEVWYGRFTNTRKVLGQNKSKGFIELNF